MNQKNNLIIGLIIAGVVVMSANVDADPRDFVEGLPNIGIMLQEITEVDSSLFVTAFWSMLETIEMAFIGTVVGVAIALPLSLLAARNLNNKFVYVPIRALLAAIRTFPSILWAILFVIIVGLGPFAGVLAIIMYTVGFIAKLQYEAIEAIEVIENIHRNHLSHRAFSHVASISPFLAKRYLEYQSHRRSHA